MPVSRSHRLTMEQGRVPLWTSDGKAPAKGNSSRCSWTVCATIRETTLGLTRIWARGRHDIVVWSIDDYGRILYGPSDLSTPVSIKVTPSPWKPIILVLSLLVLMASDLAPALPPGCTGHGGLGEGRQRRRGRLQETCLCRSSGEPPTQALHDWEIKGVEVGSE